MKINKDYFSSLEWINIYKKIIDNKIFMGDNPIFSLFFFVIVSKKRRWSSSNTKNNIKNWEWKSNCEGKLERLVI